MGRSVFPLSLVPVDMSGFSGNSTFASVLAQSSQWGASNVSLTAIFLTLSIAIISAVLRSSSDDKIHKIEGFYFAIVSNFFSKRYDFFRENFKKAGVKMLQFNLFQVSSYGHGSIFRN
jgi:sterol 14-demethylase